MKINEANDLLNLFYGALGVLIIMTQVLGKLMLYISYSFALKCFLMVLGHEEKFLYNVSIKASERGNLVLIIDFVLPASAARDFHVLVMI